MQDRATELLAVGAAGDEAYELVRARVQALISAARDLSDTCADLADALRPLPGHEGGPDFGPAERAAALLDEAASAARGTLGLLHSAYSALERQLGRPPAPEAPGLRSGISTWPDAFVELPPRTFTVDDEAGTPPAARGGSESNGTVRAGAVPPSPGDGAESAADGGAPDDAVAETWLPAGPDSAADERSAEDDAARRADAGEPDGTGERSAGDDRQGGADLSEHRGWTPASPPTGTSEQAEVGRTGGPDAADDAADDRAERAELGAPD
ncbi:MAG TPA: hypothetical protein VE547_08430, partial [Mycobacteriales bacterium]|nr:hypothetical protein [Mycobacteriales bacterium]